MSLDSFYLGETVVTQELYHAVTGENPSKFIGDKRPVETVSWNKAQEFILKLNALTGENFRLPTETEWEWAAREGGKDEVIFGNGTSVAKPSDIRFNAKREYLTPCLHKYIDGPELFVRETAEVKSFPPNALGFYELSGNVSEWCQDWGNGVGDYKIGHNPQGREIGGTKIHRGGSWQDDLFLVTATYRKQSAPTSASCTVGFRLAI